MRTFFFLLLFIPLTMMGQSRYYSHDYVLSFSQEILVVTEPGFNFTIEFSYLSYDRNLLSYLESGDSIIVEYAYPSRDPIPDWVSGMGVPPDSLLWPKWRPCVLWDIPGNTLISNGLVRITSNQRLVPMDTTGAFNKFTYFNTDPMPSALVSVWIPQEMTIRIRAINVSRMSGLMGTAARLVRVTYWK